MKKLIIIGVAGAIIAVAIGAYTRVLIDDNNPPELSINLPVTNESVTAATTVDIIPATTTTATTSVAATTKKTEKKVATPKPATAPASAPAPEIDIIISPATTTVPAPSPISITTKAIVGLLCHGEGEDRWKGSGVIINPKGYILTNKHVAEKAEFCEVAIPGNEIILPTLEEIRQSNPFPQLDGTRFYKAIVHYLPTAGGLSEDETRYLDFAIMKISGLTDDCKLFSGCGPLPAEFPFNPVSRYMPGQGEITISYGYPAEGSASDLSTFRLKGIIGSARSYIPGDQRFLDRKFIMVRFTDWGTFFGASGSGVFFNGQVVGLVYSTFEYNKNTELVIPMQIIYDVMKEQGVDWILTYQ